MGMSIDEHLLYEMGYNKGFKDGIKGSIPKADYDNRLKADMVAMLTEIKAEIMVIYASNNEAKFIRTTCRDIVQEKINILKEDT